MFHFRWSHQKHFHGKREKFSVVCGLCPLALIAEHQWDVRVSHSGWKTSVKTGDCNPAMDGTPPGGCFSSTAVQRWKLSLIKPVCKSVSSSLPLIFRFSVSWSDIGQVHSQAAVSWRAVDLSEVLETDSHAWTCCFRNSASAMEHCPLAGGA